MLCKGRVVSLVLWACVFGSVFGAAALAVDLWLTDRLLAIDLGDAS